MMALRSASSGHVLLLVTARRSARLQNRLSLELPIGSQVKISSREFGSTSPAQPQMNRSKSALFGRVAASGGSIRRGQRVLVEDLRA